MASPDSGSARALKHVRSEIVIEAPADAVWSLLTEFASWPEWGPTVSRVDSQASSVAPGVTGRVKTVGGLWLPFAITEVEPGRSWTWKVAGVPATGHRVAQLANGRTRVRFTVPVAFAPYVVVLRAGLRRLKRLAEGNQT